MTHFIKLVKYKENLPFYFFLKREYIGIITKGQCNISYDDRESHDIEQNTIFFAERGVIHISECFSEHIELVFVEYKFASQYPKSHNSKTVRSDEKLSLCRLPKQDSTLLSSIINSTNGNLSADKAFTIYEIASKSSEEIKNKMEFFNSLDPKFYDKMNSMSDDIKHCTKKEGNATKRQSLTRFFNKHFGIAPHKWHIKFRMMYAKYLVYTTNLKIETISKEAGFNDTSNFISKYKKEYGNTPFQGREPKIKIKQRK